MQQVKPFVWQDITIPILQPALAVSPKPYNMYRDPWFYVISFISVSVFTGIFTLCGYLILKQ